MISLLMKLKLMLFGLVIFGIWCLLWQHIKSCGHLKRKGKTDAQNITILLWHWPFNRTYTLAGDLCWDKYRMSHGCFLTDNQTAFARADVVVFHHHELKRGWTHLPLHLPRPPGQKWLWLSLESPTSNGPLADYNGVFNWTMSYRRDADIFMPYGKLVPRAATGNPDDDDFILGNKTDLACWVVSNYKHHQERSKVYHQLSKLMEVRVYGNWVKRHLSDRELLPTISRCFFYLAFENSNWTDYITEKLWRNSFQAGAVPVVLGPPKPNYEALVPPKSFIHVEEFKSMKDLAGFLKKLTLDKKSYASYFKWRQHHKVKLYTDWRERLCTICLQYKRLPAEKLYKNLDTWANKRTRGQSSAGRMWKKMFFFAAMCVDYMLTARGSYSALDNRPQPTNFT